MSSSQSFNFAEQYVAEAMAADLGVEPGAAVPPPYPDPEPVHPEPEDAHDESLPDVPTPQDAASNPEVAPPSNSQPESPAPTDVVVADVGGEPEPSSSSSEARGRDLEVGTPSDPGAKDGVSIEPPVQPDGRQEVAVASPQHAELREQPSVEYADSEQTAQPDQTEVSPAEPVSRDVDAQPEKQEADRPLTIEEVVQAAIREQLLLEASAPAPELKVDQQPDNLPDAPDFRFQELEDSFDVSVSFNEAEIWDLPEDQKSVKIEHHNDVLEMNMDDALGPGVNRKDGY